ncbi:hypothetical protein AVEN_112037-1 [Araneus ventricosus]|uniref:DNA-directed RNA polymerase n=1 Tax=Araneus ventricosus TaxID=182803 RepID=A0A4Y2QQE7_ARAVE|nr:hypothetical protein AVEN_112037-1 [Araneus ventricosus]
MPLDVKSIIEPVLSNFNQHVHNFIHLLKRIHCTLTYDGPSDFHHHVRDKTVYACSVRKRGKLFKNVFPIMLGSKLDIAIRKEGRREFDSRIDVGDHPFDIPDIGSTLFLINGCLRHLPYFFTNDPTNMHVVKNKKVRCYAYDADDKGKELNYSMDDDKLYVVRNDGTESLEDASRFFDFCPYPTDQETYMSHVYKENRFDIDHLANKIVVSPGHLFVKLFVKYLYVPLRDEDWPKVKSKWSVVAKSIENGSLLHVLSRKTVYFKESKSAGKMVSIPRENHRELGMNGEIYVEKNTGCYREANLQIYPLFPYLSHLILRQISSKVKNNSALAFQDSYVGFFCILGSFETKNIGRTHIMVRNSIASACNEMDVVAHDRPGRKLYELLDLTVVETRPLVKFHVVVNEACVPVTELCFHRVTRNLIVLKNELKWIECYQKGRFVHIKYKTGLFLKKMGDIYVTPADEPYWASRAYGLTSPKQIVDRFGYDYITGHHVDLNRYFMHNAFPKNCFGKHTLKSAVFPIELEYLVYFMVTVSCYAKMTPHHKPVLEPVDDFSKHFVMYVPFVLVAFMSFMGNNQEDCIVMREGLDAFDCITFYTLRFKMDATGGPGMVFHPVTGDSEGDFLGTLVYHGPSRLEIEMLSVHVKTVRVGERAIQLYFIKHPFKFLRYELTEERLAVCVERYHAAATGNKLSNLHGQKGVVHISERMPTLDDGVTPDLCVSPFGAFRQTVGQYIEGIGEGGGKDARVVRNAEGNVIPGGRVLYQRNWYFPVSYMSCQHLYAPTECVRDKINDQPVKGRSRFGGMRIGNMEMFNGLEGNGIASCFEEKFFEHGDRTLVNGVMIPKSALLVKEDMRFFKANLELKTTPCVREIGNEC